MPAYFPQTRSQQYSAGIQASEPWDMRFSPNSSNQGGAAPGGFNTGNPMFDMAAAAAAKHFLGVSDIRPYQGFSGPGSTYLESRMRTDAMAERPMSLPYMPGIDALGKMGQDPAVRWGANQLGFGGGDQGRAAEYGMQRFGPMMGRSIREQARVSQQMTENIVSGFSADPNNPSSGYSYNRSFGYDSRETMMNMDSLRSAGLGGVNEALKRGVGGDAAALKKLASQSNEFMRQGREAFGPDMGNDEMLKLMDKAMGGLNGVTPEKASELLGKIQTTSRALDVSTEAFAQYMAMQQNLYKEMGVGGKVATDMILAGATDAQLIAKRAQASGNTALADEGKTRAIVDAQNRETLNSSGARTSTAVINDLDRRYSQDEKNSLKIGNRSVSDFFKEMGAAQKAGDEERVKALTAEGLNSGLVDKGQVISAARNQSSSDVENAINVTGGSFATVFGSTERSKIAKAAAGASGGNVDAITKAMSGIDDIDVLRSKQRLTDQLEKNGYSSGEAKDLAGSISGEAQAYVLKEHNSGQFIDQIKARFASGSAAQAADRETAAKKAAVDTDRATLMRGVSGELSKGLAGMGPDALVGAAEVLNKKKEEFDARKAAVEKNGQAFNEEFGLQEYASAFKEAGIDISKGPQLQFLRGLYDTDKDGKNYWDRTTEEANGISDPKERAGFIEKKRQELIDQYSKASKNSKSPGDDFIGPPMPPASEASAAGSGMAPTTKGPTTAAKDTSPSPATDMVAIANRIAGLLEKIAGNTVVKSAPHTMEYRRSTT